MIAKSAASCSGTFIEPGSGMLIVKHQEESGGFNGLKFLVEFYVLDSKDDPNAKNEQGEVPKSPRHANPVGSTCSTVWMLDGKNKEMSFSNIKRYAEDMTNVKDPAVLDFLQWYYATTEGASNPEADVIQLGFTMEMFEKYQQTAETQPLRGKKLAYHTIQKWTKDKSKYLTIPQWDFVEETAVEIAKNRAMLDALATGAAAPATTATA